MFFISDTNSLLRWHFLVQIICKASRGFATNIKYNHSNSEPQEKQHVQEETGPCLLVLRRNGFSLVKKMNVQGGVLLTVNNRLLRFCDFCYLKLLLFLTCIV